MGSVTVAVQTEVFDTAQLLASLQDNSGQVGAVVTFTGLVRDLQAGGLQSMQLEHYPGMTEKSLARIADEAQSRWQLIALQIVHRVGCLHRNDPIVYVGASSAHREDAFAACQFVMDYLKRDAPFWKKECTNDGEAWVAQKASDLKAAKKW